MTASVWPVPVAKHLTRPLLGPVLVYPWCEIGVGDSRQPSGQAVWNTSRWDTEPARWAGTEPTWLDVSCEVIALDVDIGRTRTVERFRTGTAEVTFRNVDGWADLSSGVLDPAVLNVRPGRQIRFGVDIPSGRVVLYRGYIDEAVPVYDPYSTDVVTCLCIDALGEVGRANLEPVTPVGAGETVNARIARILDRVAWPATYRSLNPSGTGLQASDLSGPVVDLLGAAADSAGGSVFGDTLGRIAYRNRDWQTFPPTKPVDGTIGNVGAADVCPAGWDLSWRRHDVATYARMGRPDGVFVARTDTAGVARVGYEPFVRQDLTPTLTSTLTTLADRMLRVRNVKHMPRVDAVHLDAATDPGDGRVVDMMAAARPEKPSRLRCRLRTHTGRDVFDAQMFVTGCRHTITDTGRWFATLSLDVAAPYVATGGRWDQASWDAATWAAAP